MPYHPPIKDWIDDLPRDFQERMYENESPTPKFSF